MLVGIATTAPRIAATEGKQHLRVSRVACYQQEETLVTQRDLSGIKEGSVYSQ